MEPKTEEFLNSIGVAAEIAAQFYNTLINSGVKDPKSAAIITTGYLSTLQILANFQKPK